MSGGATLPVDDRRAAARRVLESGWRPEGYTVPNDGVYPFQWLWDSCFHAIVWADLGDAARATSELHHVFRTQDSSGFVPHIDYEAAPTVHADFWGRIGSSSITQPPMYGHALAELHRRGIAVDAGLVDRATAGLRFLLDLRARDEATGLVTIVHPWESGADDSPRWDHWRHDPLDMGEWYDTKGSMLDAVERSGSGAPIGNPEFDAAPAGFNALIAFNAIELASVSGDAALEHDGVALAEMLAGRWDDSLATWVDGGSAATTSGAIRVLDALLPVLVCEQRCELVLRTALDERHYGGDAGPAGVHRDEPVYAPTVYWRGPAWPQLTYLLWVAARRQSLDACADELASALIDGATVSGWAEYWHPDTGAALGARPQGWATLAAVTRPVSE